MRQLLLILGLTLVLLPSSAPGLAVSDTTSQIKWYEFRNILGKIEEEYDRLQVLNTEMSRLKNVCEDLRVIQFYPTTATKLTKEDALRIDKRIGENEKAMEALKGEIAGVNEPQQDAIAMLRELITEDQEAQMLTLLERESGTRVAHIIEIKHRLNDLWKAQQSILDEVCKISGLPTSQAEEMGGFDSEFFQMLYYNLGMSSDQFMNRLNIYKDSLIRKMEPKAVEQIAKAELAMVKRRLERGEYAVVERDLLDIEKRYDQRVPMNGIYYYLGQVSQYFAKYKEAINYYGQISKTSQYYIKGLAGILQAHYAEGKYSRIDFLYEKMQADFVGKGDVNAIYLTVCQAYYELKRDQALIDLSARAEKNKPYYLGILYTLGQSYTRNQDYSTARAIFKTVIEAKNISNSDEPFVQRARISLAHLDYAEGRYAPALKQYVELLDVQPLFAEALNGVAWCFVKLGNYTKAEIALKKLVNQEPEEPSGCEAMLLLAQNFLNRANSEWLSRRDQVQNASRIKLYEDGLRRRLREHDLDTLRFKEGMKRLDRMLKETRAEEMLKSDDVAELFRKTGESVDLLVNSYQTGNFINNPFKNMKQELLIRVRDLFLKSKNSTGQAADNHLNQKEADSKKRERILQTVIQAREFKVQYLLQKRDWQAAYTQYMIQTIDTKIQTVKADTALNDSLRPKALAKWQDTRNLVMRSAQMDASRDQETMLTELYRLKESGLDDEQEAFTLYFLGEAHYKLAQDVYLRQDDEYERLMVEYKKQAELFAQKLRVDPPNRPAAPTLSYVDAKEYFNALLQKYPDSRYSDGALYGLLFCASEENDKAEAIRFGEDLVSRFPNSEYAPQAYLILGEYYFDENKLELALQRYQKILQYPESKWFDKALYKIGWTYYRLSDVKRAISAFFYLIDEQNVNADGGVDLDLMKQSLLTKESIDYIAISFSETDTTADEEMIGLKKAKRFVKMIKNDQLGSKILHRLGDVYKEQFKYANAIETYKELKNLFPNYSELPKAMYGVIECYEQKGQFQVANDGRRQLFAQYNHNSEWAGKIKDTLAFRLGDSIAEQCLLEAASYTYSQALEKKNKDIYRQVIDMYWDYIKTYPDRDKASECHYYIAEILFGTGDYLAAATQYMEVSQKYKNSKYCETAAMNAIVAAQNLLKQEEANRNSGEKQ